MIYLRSVLLFVGIGCQLPCIGAKLCVRVNDPTFAPLPDVVVTIVELGGSRTPVQIRSNSDGTACTSDISEGSYRLDFWKPGFLHASFQPVSVYPEAPNGLTVMLPLGEIREGGVALNALLSGTLLDRREPVSDARICMIIPKMFEPTVCVDTNHLGEYAVSIAPGEYYVDITKGQRRARRTRVVVSSAGTYRNKIQLLWME